MMRRYSAVMMGRYSVVVMSLFWMLTSLVICAAESQNTCTDINRFSNLEHGKYLAGSEFKAFSKTTLLVCVKQCQLRTRCVSFNFVPSTGDCVLNDRYGQVNVTDSPKSVYGDVVGWPNMLPVACASHTCPENTVCVENGTGGPDCLGESCVDPPEVENAQVMTSSPFVEVGGVVPYVCAPAFLSAGEKTCLPNGTWSGGVQCVRMRHCADVKTCNGSYRDGEYWMYVFQDEFYLLKVYCHNMQDEIPIPYLTLRSGNTYSVFPNQTTAERCGAEWSAQHCGQTVFNKVRFYPWHLHISLFDYTFAETDCEMSPLGWAGDCRDCDRDSVQGSFRIDTTGTGVKLSPDITWVNQNDTIQNPYATRSEDGMVVNGKCSGGCGTCIPIGEDVQEYTMSVLVDPTSHRDTSGAIFPQCSLPKSEGPILPSP